jgi:hypothetical protein
VENIVLEKVSGEAENAPENVQPDGPSFVEFLCGPLAVLWKDWPRDMKVTLLDASNSRFSLNGTCPHCRRDSVFIPVVPPHSTKIDSGHYQLAAVMQCQGCLKYILGIVAIEGIAWLYREHYPMGTPDDSVDASVPASIAADFSEALRCLWVGSPKAAVAMCRRSVEASCADLKAVGKNLKEKIDDLAKRGIITDPLRQMAHRVRLTANEKLHGKPDDLDAFTDKDAEAIIACLREYFHHVYVMPALLKAYEKPKAGTGGSTPPSPPSGSTP